MWSRSQVVRSLVQSPSPNPLPKGEGYQHKQPTALPAQLLRLAPMGRCPPLRQSTPVPQPLLRWAPYSHFAPRELPANLRLAALVKPRLQGGLGHTASRANARTKGRRGRNCDRAPWCPRACEPRPCRRSRTSRWRWPCVCATGSRHPAVQAQARLARTGHAKGAATGLPEGRSRPRRIRARFHLA